MHETFGEDPYLCAALGVAYVRGLQGQDLSQGVMATGKHFLGYAVPPGGLNTSAFEAGARISRDLFAYPFEAAIRLAGLRSVMNSYADTDGIPAGRLYPTTAADQARYCPGGGCQSSARSRPDIYG